MNDSMDDLLISKFFKQKSLALYKLGVFRFSLLHSTLLRQFFSVSEVQFLP